MVAQPPVSSPETSASEVSTLDQLLEKLHQLSPEHQKSVLDFVEFLAQKDQLPQKSIWDEIDELMADIPDEVWDKIPTGEAY